MRDRTIVPSLAGILVGYLAAVTAVAVGVGAAVSALPWVLIGLTFAAAGYLAFLGVRVLRQPPAIVTADAVEQGSTGGAATMRPAARGCDSCRAPASAG